MRRSQLSLVWVLFSCCCHRPVDVFSSYVCSIFCYAVVMVLLFVVVRGMRLSCDDIDLLEEIEWCMGRKEEWDDIFVSGRV